MSELEFVKASLCAQILRRLYSECIPLLVKAGRRYGYITVLKISTYNVYRGEGRFLLGGKKRRIRQKYQKRLLRRVIMIAEMTDRRDIGD